MSVIAIAPPLLQTGIAKLLMGRQYEALQSQVRPVLRCQAKEGRFRQGSVRQVQAGSVTSVDSSEQDVQGRDWM